MQSLILLTIIGLASASVYVNKSVDPLPAGAWSGYINYGDPYGVGEYETVWTTNYYGDCDIQCDLPIAVEVTTEDGDINEMIRCRPEGISIPADDGFLCDNVFASSYSENSPADCYQGVCEENGLGAQCKKCPNVTVRFYCKQTDIDNFVCESRRNERRAFQGVMMREFHNFMNDQREIQEKRWMERREKVQKKSEKKKEQASVKNILAKLIKELEN